MTGKEKIVQAISALAEMADSIESMAVLRKKAKLEKTTPEEIREAVGSVCKIPFLDVIKLSSKELVLAAREWTEKRAVSLDDVKKTAGAKQRRAASMALILQRVELLEQRIDNMEKLLNARMDRLEQAVKQALQRMWEALYDAAETDRKPPRRLF